MKKIPVKIPLSYDGSISDVIQDFINTMQEVTGGNVDLDIDLQGNVTIYYQSLNPDPKDILMGHNKPNSNKHPFSHNDIDVEYRDKDGNVKSSRMSESNFKKIRNARKNTDR